MLRRSRMQNQMSKEACGAGWQAWEGAERPACLAADDAGVAWLEGAGVQHQVGRVGNEGGPVEKGPGSQAPKGLLVIHTKAARCTAGAAGAHLPASTVMVELATVVKAEAPVATTRPLPA